ncbi:MAG: transcriptional repressor [Bacteroidetes bacterium]|nr:MAG: transcriptional repressor [Bacteroidota bacterium]
MAETQTEHVLHTLRNHKLRVTDTRIKVLAEFIAYKRALTQTDLEANLGKEFDRVTIYRTLHSFLESGILHKIPDDSGATQYALCDNCDVHAHHDEHIHFKCTNCQKIECLDHYTVPKFEVPVGYSIKTADLVVTGVCAQCASA